MDAQALRQHLRQAGDLANEGLSTSLWLGAELQRPLLLDGGAGAGKTALADAQARAACWPATRPRC